MAYVFVTGAVKVNYPITDDDYIKEILKWIGITIEYQSDIIYDDSIKSFSDIRMFKDKYIQDLSTEFPEGLRLMEICTLVREEIKGLNHYYIGCKIFIIS